jgi:hypothetical protein
MADFTQIADLITPSVFTGYTMERTKELTAFVSSGILQEDGVLREWMQAQIGAGGGSYTLNRPTWNDLDSSGETPGTAGAERISSDVQSPVYLGNAGPLPQGIDTHTEVAVRVERNNHWAAAALAAVVSGAKNPDAIAVIGSLVGGYWARRFQHMAIAIVKGVQAGNALTTDANHTQNDLMFDVSGGGFTNGVTNFQAAALYDALQTLGDADNQITNIAVHSAVRNGMRKNNLIDTVRDSDGNYMFDAFQNLRLTVDDSLPVTGQVYDSYLFGPGFLRYATVAPKNATTTVWRDDAGNGAGSEELWNRVGWCIHPMGHKFAGSVAASHPDNSATSGDFAHSASWVRSAQSRKHIPFAILRTREA